MAVPIYLKFPTVPSTLTNRTASLFVPLLRRSSTHHSHPHSQHTIRLPTIRSNRNIKFSAVNAVQESQENTESDGVEVQAGPPTEEPKTADQSAESGANLGAEIQEALKQRKVEKEGDLIGGVAEEIKEIEWPAFRKVLGTTGVVIGVIAGSSVVLLTVNALLAELSDRVFAGKGVQDFFS
ncbi:preprotein translocase subunit SECE1 [Cucumis melo var. makuwa]|uniref:Preprotein translocase subunit SECE1 n=1 Tax=Cucumis melo var. makuwa TaxID=1194695 RepID=A0A5D3D089_CUCMM|nr:preprotein translocase subunit SECE1 [Cucumis melo var. makuwa]TYK17195.1 preprotein translocase subunit SECE1 [Cucumis melo var. makuwa]